MLGVLVWALDCTDRVAGEVQVTGVRTGADCEDEEGDGVEHVAHGGGLRECRKIV